MAGFEPASYGDTQPLAEINYAPSYIRNDPTLPPGAKARVVQLQQRFDDLRAVMPAFEDRHLASLSKMECQRKIDRLLEHPSRGGFGLPDDAPQVKTERTKLAALTAESARLESLYTARTKVFQGAGAILSRVRGWLAEAHGSLEDFDDGPGPTLQKGETILDAIARTRARVGELKKKREEIERAPLPRVIVRAKIRQQVLELAAKGAPSIGPDGKISAASQRMSVPVIAGTRETPVTAIVHWEQPDLLALIAFLNPEGLIAAITKNEAGNDSGSMTDEARRAALAETAAALLAAERIEAHWVWRGLDELQPNIEFRPDHEVRAVLKITSSAPRALAAGSSDAHSYGLVS